METQVANRYASLIGAEDVESLFANLAKLMGSIVKASEKCGVARTTPYGWSQARYVKSTTKMKILKASLEENLIETLGFLAGRSKERTVDILLTYLSSIYQSALREDREPFENLLHEFLNARQEHYGLIEDEVRDEVGKMMHILTGKARGFQIPISQDPVNMIESNYLLEIVPDLIHDLLVERRSLREIANRYSIPIEVPRAFENALDAITLKPTSLAQVVEEDWTKVITIDRNAAALLPNPPFGLPAGMAVNINEYFDLKPQGGTLCPKAFQKA